MECNGCRTKCRLITTINIDTTDGYSDEIIYLCSDCTRKVKKYINKLKV